MKNIFLVSLLALSVAGCFTFSDGDFEKPDRPKNTDTNAVSDSDADTDIDADSDSDTSNDCPASRYWNGKQCQPCTVDAHCGSSCATCGTKTPLCVGTGNDASKYSCSCEAPTPQNASGSCGYGNTCVSGKCTLCNTADHCGGTCNACFGKVPLCLGNGDDARDWACGCSESPAPHGSCEGGTRCVAGGCESCVTAEHCGPACGQCSGSTPVCGGSKCVCNETSCGPYHRCDVNGQCLFCGSDDHCGSTCGQCDASKPKCLVSGKTSGCVECLSDTNCRTGAVAPFNSPLGLCTPDNTCTCWANKEINVKKWHCALIGEKCPTGFVCAEGNSSIGHYGCFRICNNISVPMDGIACKSTYALDHSIVRIWAPATTCYAYDMYNKNCALNSTICGVSDISPGIGDGWCVNDKCTFKCEDADPLTTNDEWCPSTKVCGKVLGLCNP